MIFAPEINLGSHDKKIIFHYHHLQFPHRIL
jgi:hypothetical protein